MVFAPPLRHEVTLALVYSFRSFVFALAITVALVLLSDKVVWCVAGT